MKKNLKNKCRKTLICLLTMVLMTTAFIGFDSGAVLNVRAEEENTADDKEAIDKDGIIDGDAVVALAESYVDKVPYVTAGNSLETGTDCSGFVILIYAQFGVDLSPYRSAQSMFDNADKYGVSIGTDLSQARAGDLIFTHDGSHVGIVVDSETLVHQTVPGSSVKVEPIKYMTGIIGIVRPYRVMAGTAKEITVVENSYEKVILKAEDASSDDNAALTDTDEEANKDITKKDEELEYKWVITGALDEETDWSRENEEYTFYLNKTGVYDAKLMTRKKGETDDEKVKEYTTEFYHKNALKGICQMPYTGEGGGYLIGIESYENPDYSYTYEMLILDCTLYAKNLPAWIYTTNRCGVYDGNAMWTVWQPQYGYYWTLFRIYDRDGNLIGEECYGFENVIK
ncbi:MAG: C40 family peptidase [Lachnospiraceae bacterium]|nr:C40 family peptidase [Lachnospiraceae bacterium]